MYTVTNFQTKKALKEAVAADRKLGVFQPGPFGGAKYGYRVTLEGPHYPQPSGASRALHKWYAQAVLDEEGYIIKVT